MQIIRMDKKENTAKIRTETPDDLWHLEKILEPGDLVTSKTLRKTTIKRGHEIDKGDRKPVTLTIPVSNEMKNNAVKLAQKLRKAGIPTQTDMMERNMKKQMEYVNKAGIPFIMFVGENELNRKRFTVRNMLSGEQKTMSMETMIKAFKKALP
ncbi:His/Gly/Thr/Pro-type tRNA ligase C-terminal domain-containing protein [Candidatus Aenigmatarchaeota archaeon]